MNLFWNVPSNKIRGQHFISCSLHCNIPRKQQKHMITNEEKTILHSYSYITCCFQSRVGANEPNTRLFIEGLPFTQATANSVFSVCSIIQDIQYKPTPHCFLYDKHRKGSIGLDFTLVNSIASKQAQRLRFVKTPRAEWATGHTLQLKQAMQWCHRAFTLL